MINIYLAYIYIAIYTQDAGVPFLIDGRIVYLRGTLILGCADNLAANLMAGYKSLTSACIPKM